MLRTLDRALSLLGPWQRLRKNERFRSWLGYEPTLWTRKVADEEVRRLVARLSPERLSALEVSGTVWSHYGFASYRSVAYPEFDICRDVLPEQFDLVIAEHVFEHLMSPQRAARHVHQMVKPGGHFLIVTPFLYQVHPCPVDCFRWTEAGLAQLLADSGFDPDSTLTDSWGNRACIRDTFRREYTLFNRYLHSVKNELAYPVVVWALARKRTDNGQI